MTPYVYVWEFKVRPGCEAEFERNYGPDGSWVELFRAAHGYLDTILLRDLGRGRRYLTIDRWESEDAYRSFRTARARASARPAERLNVAEDPAALGLQRGRDGKPRLERGADRRVEGRGGRCRRS